MMGSWREGQLRPDGPFGTIGVMKIIRTVVAAAAGAAAGHALHQMRDRDPGKDGVQDIVIAAPPANIAAGALIGLISGSPGAAFATGLGISAVLGDQFEEAIRSHTH